MNLSMVGTGYVGLVTGVCLSNTGNQVYCLDTNAGKIEMLRRGQCPIYEPGLTDLMERNTAAGRLKFTTDAMEAHRHADMIFICVGTPSDDRGHTDLRYILGAADDVAHVLKQLGPGERLDVDRNDRLQSGRTCGGNEAPQVVLVQRQHDIHVHGHAPVAA